MNRTFVALSAAALGAATLLGLADWHLTRAAPAARPAQQATPAPTAVPVGGKIQAENACYVRLPDAPETLQRSGRYAMFGGYNPKTGVLATAGGAYKASDENTIAYYEMYGIKLDGAGTWKKIPYSSSVGYTQDTDKGCREMANVQVSDTNWISVFGKDGCDNGAFDTSSKKGGDIKELTVGADASPAGVKWVGNSGASELIGELKDNKGKLARLFAAWDQQRSRVVFGQGTFDDERDQSSQDAVYAAKKVGSKFQLTELKPGGPIPVKRFGSCAAYVSDKDAGVDGIIVLGGQQGNPEGVAAVSYKEVWWLDFKSNANGTWSNITGRFGNMDAIGFRREGACAYDPASKHFYSWMGRADSKIPDGASHSTGAWRVSLAQLGDTNASLTWERLAKDNTKGLSGRRLVPSVWDAANKRMLVVGGRVGNDALKDVWAIYPDVTGAACEALDPYAPFRPGVATPTPTRPSGGTVAPTNTPGGGGGTPVPTAVMARSCPQLQGRVPDQVIADGLANPARVQGWGIPANSSLPIGASNPPRSWLSLKDYGKAFHPVYNSVVYKAGCP